MNTFRRHRHCHVLHVVGWYLPRWPAATLYINNCRSTQAYNSSSSNITICSLYTSKNLIKKRCKDFITEVRRGVLQCLVIPRREHLAHSQLADKC